MAQMMVGGIRPGMGIVDEKLGYSYDGMEPGSNEAILKQMKEHLDEGVNWWEPIWEQAAEDVEFVYGNQWPDGYPRSREETEKIQLTINMMPQYVHRATGAARQSKFAIHVSQIAGPNLVGVKLSSPGSGRPYNVAEIMEGIIRDIEYRSGAQRLYCNALQHAIEGGIGWLRINIIESPIDPFALVIEIEHVLDRWSVMLDPQSGKSDFSTARWGAVSQKMPRKAFEALYKDMEEIPAGDHGYSWGGWSRGETTNSEWWGETDHVRFVEYFWKQPVKRTAVKYMHPIHGQITDWADNHEEVMEEMKRMGFRETDRKDVDTYRVKWIRATQDQIIDGPFDWPTIDIPLVLVYGREVNHRDTREYASLARWSYDAQRMQNHWLSAATRRISLVPESPYMAREDMIAGKEQYWTGKAIKEKLLLISNDTEDGKMPERQHPPQMPLAELQLMEQSKAFIQDTTGIHEAALGKKSNETSGKAILERKTSGDTILYDFTDHLGGSIQRIGDMLVRLVPEVYSQDQMVHLVLPEQTGGVIQINHPFTTKDGKTVILNSLSLARYSCRTEVGPAFATQMQEFFELMMEWGRTDANIWRIAGDKIVESMQMPGKEVIAKRLKYQVPRELLTEEEAQNLPKPQPSPEEQIEAAKAQAMMAKSQSDEKIALLKLRTEEINLRIAEVNLETERLQAAQTLTDEQTALDEKRRKARLTATGRL